MHSAILDRAPACNILVMGDVMLDRYLQGTADRLCPEAPVPVVNLGDRQDSQDSAGGAANAAVNLASLGGQVTLLAVVGSDDASDRLGKLLAQAGVAVDFLPEPDRHTLSKQRILANGQLLLRLDQGSTHPIAAATEASLIDRLQRQYAACQAVLISDYGYGGITPAVRQALQKLQARSPRWLTVDAKTLLDYRTIGATAIKPNYAQACDLLNLPRQSQDRAAQLLPHADRLLALTQAEFAAITLDCEGALLCSPDRSPLHLPTRPAPTAQTSGAGDTFLAAFTLALATQAAPIAAFQFAAAAAGIVVQTPGTTPCPAAALR